MVELNIVLILGDDLRVQDQKVLNLKKKFLADNPATVAFNIDEVDGSQISLKTLQEILKRLPFKSKQRLLIIRAADRLDDSITKFLLKSLGELSKVPFKIVFIAASPEDKAQDKLIGRLKDSEFVEKIYCQQKRKGRVFDLARNIMEYGNTVASLDILRELLSQGVEAPQVLGGLFWYWNNSKSSQGRRNEKKDLELFLDTDMKIKTGKVGSSLALELLVVKLCQQKN